MIQEFLYGIIKRPIYTEKATLGAEVSKHVFEVVKNATKTQIKTAFAKIFNAKVVKINILNYKPKKKVFKGRKGERNGYKKAVVTFAKGEKLDFVTGA